VIFLFEIIRLGLKNLRLHMLRSILTALGIILGVTAVITMVSIGEGSKREALAQLERLGARNIIVRSKKPPETTQSAGGGRQSYISRYGLSREDIKVIQQNFPDATAIVPTKSIGSQVLREDRRQVSQAFGVTPNLLKVAGLRIARGRYLTTDDMDARAMVAVIGSEVAREMFPFDDPLGKTLRIDDQIVSVVGVLSPVGLSGGAGAALIGRDINKDVHIPLTTAQTAYGDLIIRSQSGTRTITEVAIHEVYVEAPQKNDVLLFADLLRRLLAVRHPDLNDIELIVPYELLEQAKRAALTWNLVLGAVAGISLLVGGIGIMNIMLANVTERTREIGIRRALGATKLHIIWQFLVETGVLSVIGGLMGVALGIVLSIGIEWLVPLLPKAPVIGQLFDANVALPTEITLWSIVLSFCVAAATGLIFGIYPAQVAAKQDPIVALRHD